jgi:hypothetical protein
MVVFGYDEPRFDGSALAELQRLRESGVVRLVDLIVVRKDAEGRVERYSPAVLPETGIERPGATIAALIGLAGEAGENLNPAALLGAAPPAEAETWYVDDALPTDTVSVIALLEHRWAIGLRDAMAASGGFHLLDAWVHPDDLAAVGVTDAP